MLFCPANDLNSAADTVKNSWSHLVIRLYLLFGHATQFAVTSTAERVGAGSIKDSDKSGCTSSEQGSRYMKKAIKPPPRWFRFSRVLTNILAFLSLLLPIGAAAQDPFSNPSFGEVSLVSGFEPDPHTVSIYAGGSVELSASRLVDCVGFVSDAPDYRVIYDSDNQQRSLSFYAESDSDTVLLVNDPNGEWYCNDDYSDELGLASGLDFSAPQSGIYDIWVGSYEDEFSSATLYVTELGDLIDPAAEGSDYGIGRRSAEGSGTAFLVSEGGHLITNFHVVSECSSIRFQLPGESPVTATVIATNEVYDLALLKAEMERPPASFPFSRRPDLGQEIVVYGFPLRGDLSSQGNLTSGVISALTGLNDDLSMFQVSAQIQPGNSGGPVFDRYGAVTGVIVAMADAGYFAEQSGSIPQNINFAIRPGIVQSFLDINNIDYQYSAGEIELRIAEIAEIAQTFTGALVCESL